MIISNTAEYAGGGVWNDGPASLDVSDSEILGNTALDEGGGGIYSYDVSMRLVRVVVSGNWADGSGGGIFNDFFGGGGGSLFDFFFDRRGRGGPRRGGDLRYDLQIAFEDAVFGAEREIEIFREENCSSCNDLVFR